MAKLIVRLYEKLRNWCYENPVDRLKKGGAEIGENVHIYDGGGASIDYEFSHLLKIGNNVTISNSTILLHDASIKKELKYTKLGKITIGNDVFIGAGSIILPNTNIGNRVIIGAGSVVSKNIPGGSVAVGNPIRIIGTYDAYMKKYKERILSGPRYDHTKIAKKRECMQREIEDWGFLG